MKSVARWLLSLLLGVVAAPAQQYVISTVAGGAPPPTPVPAVNASIGTPLGIGTDAVGNLYFGSNKTHCVFKIDLNGVLTRVAGNGREGYSGDGGPAASAQLMETWAVAADAGGNLYIADGLRVRKVTPDGVITTVAGNGTWGFSGDGGPATGAQLASPDGLAVDAAGNLYIADAGNRRVRRVSPGGIISTVAGDGSSGESGDGGPAASAQIKEPAGLALDADGNLYIADTNNNRIRKVSPQGIISTVAGSGLRSFSGDGGPATQAELNRPSSVAVDSAGALYIVDRYNFRIRKVSPQGVITTVAGTGAQGYTGDGGPATQALLNYCWGVAADVRGNIYISDGNNRVRKVSPGGIITAFAGNGIESYSGDGGPAVAAQLNSPSGVSVDASGNLYVAEYYNHRIRKVSPAGVITTFAGNGTAGRSGDGGPAAGAQLFFPDSVLADAAGNVYISEYSAQRVRKVSSDGAITTFAGTGTSGRSGDGGPATSAQLSGPTGLAMDAAGSLYIADRNNFRIRKVSPDGIITTFAGSGVRGYSGDGGPATSAQINCPDGLAVDAAGNLFFADTLENRVRKVALDGVITTVAGSGVEGFSGDSGPAMAAQIARPAGLGFDAAGNLYIVQSEFSRIRKVSPAGTITTVAGNGDNGYYGDGGPALEATFTAPAGMCMDAAGGLYVADEGNDAVRLVRPAGSPPSLSAVTNAASGLGGAVAPGEFVSLYGTALGPVGGVSAAGMQKGLAGVRVTFKGVEAFLTYVSSTQINALVPYGVTASADVVTEYQGASAAAFSLQAADAVPGIFTQRYGPGQAWVVNQDHTFNSEANAASRGSYIAFWATGQGLVVPAGTDGESIAAPDFPKPKWPVKVRIGGLETDPDFAGLIYTGVLQVNVKVPDNAPVGGAVQLQLIIGSAASRTDVTLAVK